MTNRLTAAMIILTASVAIAGFVYGGSFTVAWDAPTTGANGYAVYIGTNEPGVYEQSFLVRSNRLTFGDVAGTNAWVMVTAFFEGPPTTALQVAVTNESGLSLIPFVEASESPFGPWVRYFDLPRVGIDSTNRTGFYRMRAEIK